MRLDLWFREDVARILAATQETMQASQAASVVNEDYQQGFVDALRAVAVAFGVATPSAHRAQRAPTSRPALLSDRTQVIDSIGFHRRPDWRE